MYGWRVTLLGKFTVERNKTSLTGLEARQVQELFSYLLLFKHRPQPRESLLETLWGDQSAGKARKKLRQILWRLQSVLGKPTNSGGPELLIDNEWIQIILPSNVWLDVEEFEKIFNAINGKSIQELTTSELKKMQYAAETSKGQLLEGWYSDWCIFERERFQIMHMMLLDKLIQFCVLHHNYDLGLPYALEILRQDRAYERAHYQLMLLYFLSGNRTQALHQYARCVMALREELDVEPSERTRQLYEQIRSDSFQPSLVVEEKITPGPLLPDKPSLRDLLTNLKEVSITLSRLEHQIKQEIVAISRSSFGQG
jgi:DNA-binding SARP family transcriptional activator